MVEWESGRTRRFLGNTVRKLVLVSKEMKWRLAVAGCLISVVLPANAEMPKRVWSLNLSSLAAYKEAALTAEDFSWGFDFDFVDDNTIAVEAVFQSRPHFTDRGPAEQVVSNTAIFTIDANKGTPQSSQVWKGWRGLPAVPYGRSFHPTATAECLINIGDRLIKLSPTGKVVATRELPLSTIQFNGNPFQDHWWILTDPRTEKALLVRSPFSPTGRAPQEGHWISLETLKDESSITLPPWSAGSGAILVGESVVFSGWGPAKEPVTIQENNEPPHPLCGQCLGLVRGSFGKELIFLDARRSYQVVDTEGKVHYRGGRLGGRADTIDQVSGAITKNRVAFQFGHLGQTLEETVVVLDVDAKKEILRFKQNQAAEKVTVGKLVEEKFVSPGLALSPDGSKLAILTGTSISLFDVP